MRRALLLALLLPLQAIAAPPPEPALLYFYPLRAPVLDQPTGPCEWRIFYPRTRRTAVYLRTPSCTDRNAVFDTRQRVTYFSDNNLFYRHRWGEPGPRPLARLQARLDVSVVYLSAESGLLRVRNAYPNPKPSGYASGLLYDTYELSSDGARWTKIGSDSWAWDSTDGPPRLPVPDARAGSYALKLLLHSATCHERPCGLREQRPRFRGGPDVRRRLVSLLEAEGEDDLGFRPFGAAAIFFPVGVGDSPHAVPPAFWGRLDGTRLARLPLNPELGQLSVSTQGNLALIASEYEGHAPFLVSDDSPRPLLDEPRAQGAVFLPFAGLGGESLPPRSPPGAG